MSDWTKMSPKQFDAEIAPEVCAVQEVLFLKPDKTGTPDMFAHMLDDADGLF